MTFFQRTLINVKNNLFFFIYLIINPKLILPLARGAYLPTHIQFQWLKKYPIKTVIDVGAHPGDLIKTIQIMFPESRVFAFEPVPKANKRLVKKFSSSSGITISNLALSDVAQKTRFFLNDFPQGSSLLPTDKKLLHKFGLSHMTKNETITITTTTLDNYFNNQVLKKHIFLKIDTQGTESQVLKGANKLLPQVSFVHVESWFHDRVYQKQDLFDDIYRFLTSQGFVYYGEIKESEFYPLFRPYHRENSLFFNPKIVKL